MQLHEDFLASLGLDRADDSRGHRPGYPQPLSRLSGPAASECVGSTTLLGDWYATVLPSRPRQVALLVSETTLLPVMMPMAPASTLLERFPNQLAAVLRRLGVDERVTAVECDGTVDCRVAATESRSVVGSMNEFNHLANAYRSGRRSG